MNFLAPALALVLGALAGPAAAAETARPAPHATQALRPVVLPAGLQQMASGELAITSAYDYSYAQDLTTISFDDLCVKNFRGTSANDVWLEVWASSQIPQIGGNLTHHLVAKYSIGLVSGYATRCVDTGAIPATPPNPGIYWNSLVIYEGSGSGRTLQYIYTDPTQGDYGGPWVSSYLYFEKPISHYITNGGNSASIVVGRIRNAASVATGRLKLVLKATPTVPRFGDSIAGTFVEREYAPLSAFSSYWNVDTGSLAVAQPAAGTYWISALVLQFDTDGKWYYTCLYTFPTQYTFTGATVAVPTSDFTFSPASPQAGQSVSFTDTSGGSPTSWSWNFGDGGTSTARNPVHAFASAGSYNVTLTTSNSGGSNARTRTVAVASPSAPSISSFSANPSAVVPGQQTILSWTSTGGTSASINQGVGVVAPSGNVTVTPVVGAAYTLTVSGPGGSANASLTISAVPSTWAGTWILPSSARAAGTNAFWTTDVTVTNSGSVGASVTLKFLGHDGAGANGPERTYDLPARATFTWPDVLASVFGRETDWGPILVRSTVTTLVAQGQTWTASPTGGSYGQSVPALGPAEAVGTLPKTLSGVRQDARFRTNVVLANLKETSATVTLLALLPDGTTATTYTTTVGPLGFVQLNLASHLGLASFVGGSLLVSTSTPGAQVASYASVIDTATADPRTILAR